MEHCLLTSNYKFHHRTKLLILKHNLYFDVNNDQMYHPVVSSAFCFHRLHFSDVKMDPKVLLAYSPIVAFTAFLWYQGALIYFLLAIPVNVVE